MEKLISFLKEEGRRNRKESVRRGWQDARAAAIQAAATFVASLDSPGTAGDVIAAAEVFAEYISGGSDFVPMSVDEYPSKTMM